MNELFDLIPPVKRARDFRLYDYRGNRYLDLYQNNGHAVLGHRPEGITKILKNTVSRGLIYDLPSVYTLRLKKTLGFFFTNYKSFALFNSHEEAKAEIEESLHLKIGKISDPVTDKISSISYYRPFLPSNLEKELFLAADILIPILPFSAAGAPYIVCFKDVKNKPQERPLSPFSLA